MNLRQVLVSRLGVLESIILLFQGSAQREAASPIPNLLLPATLVNHLLPAYQILQRAAMLQPGERLLVHDAASPTGLALLQLGRLSQLRCFGTASASKHELIEALGATGIDSRRENFLAATRTLCGDGVDGVVHPVDLPHVLRSYRSLRRGGRLVLTFSSINREPWMVRLQAWLWAKLLNLLPDGKRVILYQPAAWQHKRPAWFRKDISLLADWMEEGRISDCKSTLA